jgi:hypothetical protein
MNHYFFFFFFYGIKTCVPKFLFRDQIKYIYIYIYIIGPKGCYYFTVLSKQTLITYRPKQVVRKMETKINLKELTEKEKVSTLSRSFPYKKLKVKLRLPVLPSAFPQTMSTLCFNYIPTFSLSLSLSDIFLRRHSTRNSMKVLKCHGAPMCAGRISLHPFSDRSHLRGLFGA